MGIFHANQSSTPFPQHWLKSCNGNGLASLANFTSHANFNKLKGRQPHPKFQTLLKTALIFRLNIAHKSNALFVIKEPDAIQQGEQKKN